MSVKLLTEHNLEFRSLKRGCTDSFESTLVQMPHCGKSHVTAHITKNFNSMSVSRNCPGGWGYCDEVMTEVNKHINILPVIETVAVRLGTPLNKSENMQIQIK